MTLKEKFKDITEVRNHNHFDILTNKLEKIADDYAIEFAEWINVNAYKYPTKTTTKELLEIFKKEKGL